MIPDMKNRHWDKATDLAGHRGYSRLMVAFVVLLMLLDGAIEGWF